jgi:diguanylate cyclase (GGDEF)-like protein
MNVNQTNTILSMHPDHRKHQQARSHSSNADGEDQDNQKSGSWREHQAVDIEQGWVDAFTPEVQSIIDTLRCEIEPLRNRLSVAEQRADEFKELATRHALLSLPNRRETLRKINHVIKHKAEFSTPPILILLHVVNADQIRREFGRQGLDQYLEEICERLSRNISETEVFGSICGNDFSLLMLGKDFVLAKLAVDELTTQVCEQPVMINSNSVAIKFLIGATDLSYVHDGEAAIALADQNMF